MSAPQGDAMISCPQCGSPIASTARFCGVCGHTQVTRTVAQYPTVAAPTAATVASATAVTRQVQPAAPDTVAAAGPGPRCAAYLLDMAAMISPALPLTTAAAVLGVAEVIYIVIPVAFVAVWLWMQIWQALTGTSFGKSMLGLRLVRASDLRPPGFGATIARSLIFVVTLGAAALPVVLSSRPESGLHDRMTGLRVIDVTVGANPFGERPATTLRRTADRGLNTVHSPIPVAQSRRG